MFKVHQLKVGCACRLHVSVCVCVCLRFYHIHLSLNLIHFSSGSVCKGKCAWANFKFIWICVQCMDSFTLMLSHWHLWVIAPCSYACSWTTFNYVTKWTFSPALMTGVFNNYSLCLCLTRHLSHVVNIFLKSWKYFYQSYELTVWCLLLCQIF